jgi:hypothetical protein
MESSSRLHDVDYNSLSSVEPNKYHISFQSHQQRKQQQHRIVPLPISDSESRSRFPITAARSRFRFRRPDPDSDPFRSDRSSIRVSLSKQSINTYQSSAPKHRLVFLTKHDLYVQISLSKQSPCTVSAKETPSSRSAVPFFFSLLP